MELVMVVIQPCNRNYCSEGTEISLSFFRRKER